MKKLLLMAVLALAAASVTADSYYQNFNDSSDPYRNTWKILTTGGLVNPSVTHGLIVDQKNVLAVTGTLPGMNITTDSALAVEWAPYVNGTDLYLTNENMAYYASLANSGIAVALSSTNHQGYTALLTPYGYVPSDDNDAVIMAYIFDPDHVTFYNGTTKVTDAAELASLSDSEFSNAIGIRFGKTDFSQIGIFIDAVGVVENKSDLTPTEVPEPGTFAFVLTGLVSLAGAKRKIGK
ncbi:MAG: hypothetical protein J6U98_09065 [Abditibacteriota bacterium]|nr:hypothetical protein [Abditibacteriota bacterium]MBP5094184.1 hypothetical protein [Abditibacteriota bacterium]